MPLVTKPMHPCEKDLAPGGLGGLSGCSSGYPEVFCSQHPLGKDHPQTCDQTLLLESSRQLRRGVHWRPLSASVLSAFLAPALGDSAGDLQVCARYRWE